MDTELLRNTVDTLQSLKGFMTCIEKLNEIDQKILLNYVDECFGINIKIKK